MTTATHLPPAALAFLRDLRTHNDRTWFDANRDRCEADLVDPCRALIRDLAARLGREFPQVIGSDAKVGGSLTRLHRDTRFGKDKSPYHTHVGMHFWHRAGKKMETPGFFVRIDPDEVLVATGMHQPEPPALDRIRKRIDADAKAWARAGHGRGFVAAWGGLDGETLKRVPAPWPADHPAADDLKRKDFTAFARLPAAAATQKEFAADLVTRWKASEPLMAFLCGATELPW